MSRLSRKNRTEKDLGILYSGGITDMFDNFIKSHFRINDEEYDYISENITEEECKIFLNENLTFTEKRNCLFMVEKYLKIFNASK